MSKKSVIRAGSDKSLETVTFRTHPDIAEHFKQQAAEEDRSISYIIDRFIRTHFRREPKWKRT